MTLAAISTDAIESHLQVLWSWGGTDLLLTAAAPPLVRVDGELHPIPDTEVLSQDAVTDLVLNVLTNELREQLWASKEVDFSFAWQSVARFRGNVFFQRGIPALALRMIPARIPTFDELLLPPACEMFAQMGQGFVLVTGPTGSGKSTTLASMLDYVNEHRACHILTIEDPIEYVHHHKRSAVNQREVGYDTDSFDRALRAALREDPDVILVGEMRDPETIQFALTIAETGHLVFATLHTNDAAQALDRISDIFPPERQTQIRVQLAASLAGVISQRLVPRIGGGMVAAFEVLVANNAIRSLVREGKTHQIRNVVQGGIRDGMKTLETSLNELVQAGYISYEDALSRALHPKEIQAPPVPAAPVAAPPAG